MSLRRCYKVGPVSHIPLQEEVGFECHFVVLVNMFLETSTSVMMFQYSNKFILF